MPRGLLGRRYLQRDDNASLTPPELSIRGVIFSELGKEESKTVGEKEFPVFWPEKGKL
jgi:hypothetical protein